MNFKSVPRPTLGSLKAGDVFLIEEKGLHDSQRVAYMAIPDRPFEMKAFEAAAVRLTDGRLFVFSGTHQVTPAKAVLTLEVPFG